MESVCTNQLRGNSRDRIITLNTERLIIQRIKWPQYSPNLELPDLFVLKVRVFWMGANIRKGPKKPL